MRQEEWAFEERISTGDLVVVIDEVERLVCVERTLWETIVGWMPTAATPKIARVEAVRDVLRRALECGDDGHWLHDWIADRLPGPHHRLLKKKTYTLGRADVTVYAETVEDSRDVLGVVFSGDLKQLQQIAQARKTDPDRTPQDEVLQPWD
jgi:hypothetical protein